MDNEDLVQKHSIATSQLRSHKDTIARLANQINQLHKGMFLCRENGFESDRIAIELT